MEANIGEINIGRRFINRFFGNKPTPTTSSPELPSPEAIKAQSVADKLSTLPFAEVKKLFFGSANGVYLVCLEDDGSAIAKPADEELPGLRSEVSVGSFYRRERAAYLVDQALGLNLTPPTVVRTVNNSPASVQEFIPNAETAYEHGARSIDDEALIDRKLSLQLDMLLVFDYLIYNSDRHDNNWLFVEDQHRIYAIDNGLSFGKDYLVQIDRTYDPNNTKAILNYLERLVNNPEKLAKLESDLSQLIKDSEVEAFRHRLFYIYNILKKYNRPDGDRVRLLFNP